MRVGATHREMRPRRRRRVGRGRRPSREAVARARATEPSEASAERRRGAEYAEIFGVDLSRVEVEMWRRSRAERVDRVEPIRRTIAPVTVSMQLYQ